MKVWRFGGLEVCEEGGGGGAKGQKGPGGDEKKKEEVEELEGDWNEQAENNVIQVI